MKYIITLVLISTVTIMFLTAFKTDAINETTSGSLYDSIAVMDAIWEDAYNNCKMDVIEDVTSEDLEFYHDQGGLMTSKRLLNEALKVNICGKVTRSLKPGSLEVYPIKGYGAVEMGLHAFHNNQEPNAPSHYAK